MAERLLSATRAQRKQLAIDNAAYPEHLVSVPPSKWPSTLDGRIEVWRSRHFLVQIFAEKNGIERLTISRTRIMGRTWQDGITWDDIQRLKRECGRSHKWGVEIFPDDCETVNVANMRHLWLLDKAPEFAWRAKVEAHAH